MTHIHVHAFVFRFERWYHFKSLGHATLLRQQQMSWFIMFNEWLFTCTHVNVDFVRKPNVFFFFIQFTVPFKIISLIETSQSIGGAKRECPWKTTWHTCKQNLACLTCGQWGARTYPRHSGEMIEWLRALKYSDPTHSATGPPQMVLAILLYAINSQSHTD